MNTGIYTLSQALYIGSVYALIAIGLTMVYSATHVINFLQGEYFVLGAAVSYELKSVHHLSWLVVIPGVIVAAVLLGLITERAIMVPIRRSGVHYAWIIVTLAGALVLEGIYGRLFTSAVFVVPPLVRGSFNIGGAAIQIQIPILIGVAIALMVSYDQFLQRSRHGRAVRAVAHDPETASTFGISIQWVVASSFVVAAVVTALAGFLVAPVLVINPTDGLSYTTNAFVAMVIGGLGSLRGAMLGGIIVGVLDAVVVNYISANLSEVVIVGFLALILLARPRGLFPVFEVST